MQCYHPIKGWRAKNKNATGKRSIVFKIDQGYADMEVQVPCGQCIGCRLERSRQWAVRCVHEASLHEENCFLTLTYNNDNLPPGGTLDRTHFPLFMKRLRKFLGEKKVRYFHCGEYGEKSHRPHYHAILFGHEFEDKIQIGEQGGFPLFQSPTLDLLWSHGNVIIGAVSFESAAYVARYIVKKQTGENSETHYRSLDPDTGEVTKIEPEYVTMSRRPGIGKGWFDKYKNDVFPKDFFTLRGVKMKPPRFYDNEFEKVDPDRLEKLKHNRIQRAKEREKESLWRLATKEKVKQKQIESLERKI